MKHPDNGRDIELVESGEVSFDKCGACVIALYCETPRKIQKTLDACGLASKHWRYTDEKGSQNEASD